VAYLGRGRFDNGAGLAPGSVAKVFQVLDKALQAAVDARLLGTNPADNVPLPRDDKPEARFLMPDEIARLADAMPERYRALVSVAAYSGLRIGELAGLKRHRINLMRRSIEVAEVVTEPKGHLTFGPPKTKAGRRVVPIPAAVAVELTEHLGKHAGPGKDGLVFPGRDGGALRATAWRQRMWHPATEAAGLAPLVPHELRHTAVALWISAGADPKRIATWAGHTSVRTILDTYGHLFPTDDDAITAKLDALMAGAKVPTVAPVIGLPR
jgi:integrase